jgi:Flp pilus assembly protein TadD/DNA-binding MarR family transcriptional regulator
MSQESLLFQAQFLTDKKIKELTVGNTELLASVVETIGAYFEGSKAKNYWFRCMEGGGKSHAISYIRSEMKRFCRKKHNNWAEFSYEGDAFSDVQDFIIALNYKTGAIPLRLAVAFENPRSLFGKYLPEVHRRMMDRDSMILYFSDTPLPENLASLQEMSFPVYDAETLTEILHKRGLANAVILKVIEVFQLYPFLPRTPSLALSLAKICVFNPALSAETVMYYLLQERYPQYLLKMQMLSPQQKRIIFALAQGKLSPKDLSQATDMGIPVINAQIKRLRDEFWLHIEKTEDDSRQYHQVSNTLLRLALRQYSERKPSSIFHLHRIWRDWRSMPDSLVSAYTAYIRKHLQSVKKLEGAPPFLLAAEALPVQGFEYLVRTAGNYIKSGNYALAEAGMEREAERSLNIGQNNRAGRALLIVGIARISMNNLEGAFSALNFARTLGEREPLLWLNLGALQFRRGEYSDARASFTEATKAVDKFPQAYTGLGFVFWKNRDNNEADKYFDHALKIEAEFAPALVGKAILLWENDNFTSALTLLKKACALFGDDYPLKLSTADVAFTAENFTECANQCWEILQSGKSANLRSEASKLFVSALAAESLKAVDQRNFGLAGENLQRALFIAPEYGEEFISDILLPYFFALAQYRDLEIWRKLTGECRNLRFNELLELLKLHDLAFRIMEDESAVVEVKKLFPEEKVLYEEIALAMKSVK